MIQFQAFSSLLRAERAAVVSIVAVIIGVAAVIAALLTIAISLSRIARLFALRIAVSVGSSRVTSGANSGHLAVEFGHADLLFLQSDGQEVYSPHDFI